MKSKRNQALKTYYKSHPDSTFEEIGSIFGISKQRAHQIIRGKNRTCLNCYHYNGIHCACREPNDMIRQKNLCPDWYVE